MKEEEEFSLKSWFVPFTTGKAISFIIILGFVVYINLLSNGFAGDDHGQILDNPLIHSLSNFPSFFKGSTLFLTGVDQSVGLYYRPLMSTIFSLIYSVSGPTPFLFHLTQLCLHITNCILILLLFKRHFKLVISFILSLIFLMHPINNEAVVYISNMQEELFVFFGLLGLLSVTSRKTIYLTPVFLLFSVLSKETGFLFLPLTILYFYFFEKKQSEKKVFLWATSIGVIVLYAFLRVVVGNTGLQTKFLYMSAHATLLERIYTIPSIFAYYLKMLLLPYPIAIGWYWVVEVPNVTNFLVPLIVCLLFLAIMILPIYLYRPRTKELKKYLFFFTALVLGLGIISQIFPLDLTVADRWFYFPMFALLGMIGVVADSFHGIGKKTSYTRITTIAMLVILFTAFLIVSFTRTSNWANNYTLCTHDAKINRESYILQYCVSNELFIKENFLESRNHAIRATELYPGYFLSWYILGRSYYELGETSNAEKAFRKTLEFNDFGLGSQELALILAYDKKVDEVKEITTKYLKIVPNSSELWYALALAYYTEGDKEKAKEASEKAYILEPTPITQKLYERLKNNLPINF